MSGFTYNGVHSSKYGLYYTMTWDEKWFSDAEYEVYDADVDWKHGGYYYGSRAKVRVFTLKCYFEEIDVATRQAIKRWLGRETAGRLIFDEMPFVYWNVRPGKVPVGNWYLDNNETHSGTVTITFKAYEPFGRLLRKYNTESSPDDGAENYVDILSVDDMPAAPTTGGTSFEVYNPGTESCGLTIELAGETENPIRFFNEGNKTYCSFESLPPQGMRVRIDGETGYVTAYIPGSDDVENGYAYHDKGVVRLSPNYGRSGVVYEYIGINGNTHSFQLSGYTVDNHLVGGSLFLDELPGVVFNIVAISDATNRVYCSMTGSGTVPEYGECTLRTVNKIKIEEKDGDSWAAPSTLALSYISIDYEPKAL